MREGASKLLAACSQKDQALEASKSLLTCNARILALLSQLQKIRKAQILERAGLRSDGDPDLLNVRLNKGVQSLSEKEETVKDPLLFFITF